MTKSAPGTPRRGKDTAPKHRKGVKLPRRAGTNTQIAFRRNENKSTHTLAKYRTGYRAAWKVGACRRYMKSIGLKEPGSYNPNNQQGGEMFALPSEVKLTDAQAKKIMNHCIRAPQLTLGNLRDIKKMLSYAYQLTQNKTGNYAGVNWAWESLNPETHKPPTKKLMPTVIIKPKGLAKAFTTEYNPHCGMAYPEWCTGLLLTHDQAVCGLRQVVDLNKIRDSKCHVFVPNQGWMATDLVGGRAKLEKSKGVRPWKLFRVCFCPKGDHKALPEDWQDRLDSKGYPAGKVPWCTTCPLNAFQAVRDLLPEDDHRTYPKWNKSSARFHETNSIGERLRLGKFQKWINIQGANPDGLTFHSNGGRKSLGKWCDEFDVPYEDSFEIHGDHWTTWKKHYQPRLRREPEFNRRTQSPNADDCTNALWRFAEGIGRGKSKKKEKEEITPKQRGLMLQTLMRKFGMGDDLKRILDDDQKNYED